MIRFPLFGDSDKAESREPSAVPAADQAAGKPVSATHPLDALTGGVFSAPTSGDRAARVRAWMATDPDPADMQQVYKELSARDKGAAKALREKLDEIKRSKGQEQLGVEWAAKAEALLDARRLNIADAMAWQRDAAKAGAPLSKEPLASLKQRLAERVKGIEDLQTRTQIQREAAVLLAQRVEVLSTKSWQDADAAQAALQADVAHWQTQVQELQQDANWSSVDPRFATQLDSSTQQLQLVVQAFDEALAQTRAAVADAAQPLPAVPVWADELRALRGESVEPAAETLSAEDQAAAAEKTAAQAKRREEAQAAVLAAIARLEQELKGGHSKAGVTAAQTLRQALKEHRKLLGAEVEGKAHAALASAGELEGWQRWRADQIRQELVQKAEALIERASPPAPQEAPESAAPAPVAEADSAAAVQAQAPTGEAAPEAPVAESMSDAAAAAPGEAVAAAAESAPAQEPPASAGTAEPAEAPAAVPAQPPVAPSGDASAVAQTATPAEGSQAEAPRALPVSKLTPRKLQETLRQLREQWKQTDQGGTPNHALWKRFDTACNDAYRIVEAWLSTMKEHAAEHKAARVRLIDELRQWGDRLTAQAEQGAADWKTAHRELLAFSRRWREAGHLSEKVFADLQPRWKAAVAQASAPLEAAQKASIALRQAMIEEAGKLGEAASLRIDAVKALQQRWQQEAQNVPLDRKHEQKLWDAFRKPIDEAFQRKSQQREQVQAALSAHDQQVLDASRALEAANASGDAQAILQAVQALEDAMRQSATSPQTAEGAAAAAPHAEAATEAAAPEAAAAEEGAPRAPAASAVQHRPAIAVRGDDRPQARGAAGAGSSAAAAGQERRGPAGRGARPGDRGGRFGDRPERAPRGPRLGDTAFRAQRDAMDHAQAALRKLSEQAHGATLTHLLGAWEQRQADALPPASELGKRVTGALRNQWVAALSAAPHGEAATALLRLEMAAEVPTPADQLDARRALQLQLLTRRNDPSPRETWGADVATVLGSGYDAAQARRLQQALKVLMRKS